MVQFASRLAALAILLFCFSSAASAQFKYINPLPESKYHNPETGIILRNGNPFSSKSVFQSNTFKISGDINNSYDFVVKLVEDNKTILLIPKTHFEEGEKITVQVNDELRTEYGEIISGTTFSFYIRPQRSSEKKIRIAQQMKGLFENEYKDTIKEKFYESNFQLSPSPLGGLPGYTILTNTADAYDAQIFGHDFNLFNSADSHYWIIENNGDSVYGKLDTVSFNNFELNSNGMMSAYHRDDSAFTIIDSFYNQVTELQMGNGYKADVHEFKYYSDKKRYMISYDPQIVDMTVYNPNYNPAATVIGLVLQEVDSDNNVIFEWSSWDHFGILDANNIGFAGAIIDAVHCNSVERDFDGNILISSRHLSEITKINRETGDIIWRMGGNKNEFTFINDPQKISWQHDARRLSNGHITVFDNGNWHTPKQSYAKEYEIDEVNKTATLVWSYQRNYNGNYIWSTAMGSVQRLPNGNTFINWGLESGNGFPSMTEVDSLGNVVWEMKFNINSSTCYRALKHIWKPCYNLIDSISFFTDSITSESAILNWESDSKVSEYILEYKKCDDTSWTFISLNNNGFQLEGLSANTCYQWKIATVCSFYNDTVIYSTQTFTTDFAVAMQNDKEENILFRVFPNPVSELLTVNISNALASDYYLSLTNEEGKKVLLQKNYLKTGENIILLDVRNLSAGIYSLELNNGHEIQFEKVVLY